MDLTMTGYSYSDDLKRSDFLDYLLFERYQDQHLISDHNNQEKTVLAFYNRLLFIQDAPAGDLKSCFAPVIEQSLIKGQNTHNHFYLRNYFGKARLYYAPKTLTWIDDQKLSMFNLANFRRLFPDQSQEDLVNTITDFLVERAQTFLDKLKVKDLNALDHQVIDHLLSHLRNFVLSQAEFERLMTSMTFEDALYFYPFYYPKSASTKETVFQAPFSDFMKKAEIIPNTDAWSKSRHSGNKPSLYFFMLLWKSLFTKYRKEFADLKCSALDNQIHKWLAQTSKPYFQKIVTSVSDYLLVNELEAPLQKTPDNH